MSEQDENPDNGIVVNYEPEPTGAQTETQEDAVPQTDDNNTQEDLVPESEDANQETAEPVAEEVEPEASEPQPEAAEGEPLDEKAKVKHAMAKQAFENRELKRRLKELEERSRSEQQNTPQPQQALVEPKIPSIDDKAIDYDKDKFDQATERWKSDYQAYLNQKSVIDQKQAKQQEKVKSFVQKSKELKAKNKEYAELVDASASMQYSEAITETILSSENPAALHYEVLKDIDRLDELNAMNPVAAIREIVRLEASLGSKEQEKPKPKTPRAVTSAPNPVKVNRGVSTPTETLPAGLKVNY